MTKTFLTSIFLYCLLPLVKAQDTSFNLYFDIAIYALNAEHKQLLRNKIESLDQQKDYEIVLEGSADYLGDEDANKVLSENRAESITEFLSANYPGRFSRIRYTGIGEQAKDFYYKEGIRGIQEHRKTKVVIKEKNNEPPPTIAIVEEPTPIPKELADVPLASKDERKEAFIEKIANLEVGEKVVLQNLQFIPGRHILREASIPTIKLLLEILEKNKTLEIEIQGHVCCGDAIGGLDGLDLDTNRYHLSKMRAKSVYDYLVKNGIDEKRLSHRGFAFDQPLHYPERNLEHQDANRRVEIKIVKN